MARSITDRMMGAATLDVATYEEVEADTTATGQAAVVVVIAAVASAIGAMGRGGPGIITMLIGTLLGWAIWSWITYFIGTRFFGGTATWGELARTIGFAQTPRILLVLAIIPVLGSLVSIAVAIWLLIAGIVAIRQALDVTTGKAVLTAIIGWIVAIIPMALLGAIL
jgi:hypothetical protein